MRCSILLRDKLPGAQAQELPCCPVDAPGNHTEAQRRRPHRTCRRTQAALYRSTLSWGKPLGHSHVPGR